MCPRYSEWSEYSVCSVTCGGGRTVRTRTCVPEDGDCSGLSGPTIETASCNGHVSQRHNHVNDVKIGVFYNKNYHFRDVQCGVLGLPTRIVPLHVEADSDLEDEFAIILLQDQIQDAQVMVRRPLYAIPM